MVKSEGNYSFNMHNESNYREVIAKLDGLHELMKSRFDENQSCHEVLIKRMDVANCRTSKNEDRIGILENWRWYMIGIFCVVVFVIDYLVNKI